MDYYYEELDTSSYKSRWVPARFGERSLPFSTPPRGEVRRSICGSLRALPERVHGGSSTAFGGAFSAGFEAYLGWDAVIRTSTPEANKLPGNFRLLHST